MQRHSDIPPATPHGRRVASCTTSRTALARCGNCSVGRARDSPRWRGCSRHRPGRLHDHDRGVRELPSRRDRTGGPRGGGRRGHRPAGGDRRPAARRRRGSAARLRAVGRARVSMPGLMDTVLNLGLNGASVEGLAARTGNRASPGTASAACTRCSAPWSRRSGIAVRGADRANGRARGLRLDSELNPHDLRGLVARFHDVTAGIRAATAARLPARSARRSDPSRVRLLEHPTGDRVPAPGADSGRLGTAVTVQQMVFGNTDRARGRVAFSRDGISLTDPLR